MKAIVLTLLGMAITLSSYAQTDPDFFKYKKQADGCFEKRDYPCAEKWYKAALAVKANDSYCKNKLNEIATNKRQAQQKQEEKRQEKIERQRQAVITDIGKQLVYVQGGSFNIGDVFGEGETDEKPVHTVTVSSFMMSKYEVTQSQWQAIMGNNPSYFKNCDNCPVENVSWGEVQVFIEKLNAKTGKNYRLPTEAEWEYAAREGGKKVRFGNGKDILDPAEANFDARSDYKQPYSKVGVYRGKTIAVGSFAPNSLGLYDMTGNVWEWCSDWYDAYSSSSQTNPTGSSTGSNRVIRGGSWDYSPQHSRVANRNFNSPSDRYFSLGFRLVSPQ